MSSSQILSKSYDELVQIDNYKKRLEYLLLFCQVAKETFGYERYLNQLLYRCPEWKATRRKIILRDQGCDLAFPGFEIQEKALVHHLNPITVEDVINRNPIVFDPNNLITTRLVTHNIIHYGSLSDVENLFYQDRKPNDTCPWRIKNGD